MIKNYKDLEIWQMGMLLAKKVYALTKKLPKEEIYGIVSQMRRSVVSIPSNIAEGQSRNSTKEFIQFLSIAKGSSSELETQLLLCVEIEYFSREDIIESLELISNIGKMFNSLIKKLQSKLSTV
ncbi:MAG: four helix bundle protein [Firmicutes bacterium]|nr:four helix bundle protein [Bacillota bacterium]